MMNWDKLLTARRLGSDYNPLQKTGEERTQFQRDYDRIIFSSAFRRMQNKTQVFPLPDHIFVHNRLTHSLEVASVGRSLGNLLSEKLLKNNPGLLALSDIGTVVSAACLAHDLGNPPFGHSGENAISDFFKNGEGKQYSTLLHENEWKDFTHFDGNANAFRLLTHQFSGKRPGGFALTYPTLASIVKYPYESGFTEKPKFGFFQSEKSTYGEIAKFLELAESAVCIGGFSRHPLVFLVEAADDICYQVMDLEDAFKLGIIDYEYITELFLGFYDTEEDKTVLAEIHRNMKKVSDKNEKIAYLRALLIGKLIHEAITVFMLNFNFIMNGTHEKSLVSGMKPVMKEAFDKIKKISFTQIYNHRLVIEIEIAGFKILKTLLSEFTGAVFSPKNDYSKKLISLIPEQYLADSEDPYHKIQTSVDFISGMTDVYALDLYRKITGMSLPGLK